MTTALGAGHHGVVWGGRLPDTDEVGGWVGVAPCYPCSQHAWRLWRQRGRGAEWHPHSWLQGVQHDLACMHRAFMHNTECSGRAVAVEDASHRHCMSAAFEQQITLSELHSRHCGRKVAAQPVNTGGQGCNREGTWGDGVAAGHGHVCSTCFNISDAVPGTVACKKCMANDVSGVLRGGVRGWCLL